MIITICGLMDGWDIPRCRTLSMMDAVQFWGRYAPMILSATEERPFAVGIYKVWSSDTILVPL